MVNRKQIITAQIVFIIGFILFLYVGVLAGLNSEWFSMVFFFYLLVYIVHNHIGFMLDLKIDTCFERLQNIITKKSDSARLEKLKIGRKFELFMIAFNAVILLLSILARQHPLMLSIILVALTITNYISMAVVFALRIKAYSMRLEELMCQTRNDAGPQELHVE